MHRFPLRLLRLPACLSGLALALAAAGPAAANPFGVERQGGDEIAAITSLTPEQARALVAKRSDATAWIDTGKAALAFARGGVRFRGALMLSGLESLDAETAAVLADYDEGPLFLDGLTELSPEAARALKGFKGGPRTYASFGQCLSLAGLETLSPEAAEELAAFPGEALFLGVRELPEASFRRLMKFGRRLYLPRLARIPAGAAESMADYRGPGLSILGLTTLSIEEARVLAGLGKRWNGRLPNVKNLTPETAAVLAGFKVENKVANKVVRLELDGATLSDEALAQASLFPGILLLRGLTADTLSDGKLAALAEFNGAALGLGGVAVLPPELAEQIATTFATKFLFLDDVTDISPEAARKLAEFPGQVSLNGLTEASPELVRALGDLTKRSLKGVTSLSPEAAAAVVEGFRGASLKLNLTSLPAETAKELARGTRNDLFLDRLTELSDEAAAALGECNVTNLWLRGLTDLSAGAAKGLASIKGRTLGPTLRLDSLRSLSPEAAEALAASNITSLELTGLETLSAETARALARSKAFTGSLPGLTELSADAAAALGTFAGKKAGGDNPNTLNLFGLTTLSPEAARGLAAFKGKLELDGLTELSADTAAALAQYAGPRLSLKGLKTLSVETAAELAKAKAWDGELPGITGFETPAAVEVAKTLAASSGSLSIPNLKLVSPKTLTALIANGNIELPPLEAIELIEEPDGSFTDDFVIPDNYPRQQRR